MSKTIIHIPKAKPRNSVAAQMIEDGIGKSQKFRHRADRRPNDFKNSWVKEWLVGLDDSDVEESELDS